VCVANLDSTGRVAEVDVGFLRQFGRSASDIYGRSLCEFMHPSVRDRIAQQVARLAGGQRARFTERVVALGFGDIVFGGELTGIAVRSEAGQVQGAVVLVLPEKREGDCHVLTGRKKLLTDIDVRILEGVAAGASTVQLAAMLCLSRGGVEYHVAALFRKLKVKNRPALISRAYSLGIFGVGTWPPRVLPDYLK
jgi:DNA-binding CsgD family transcriptional regulator